MARRVQVSYTATRWDVWVPEPGRCDCPTRYAGEIVMDGTTFLAFKRGGVALIPMRFQTREAAGRALADAYEPGAGV